MGTLPTTPSRSTTTTDPILAALSVVCPLICGRLMGPEEIVYVRSRVENVNPDILCEAIEWLGDHAERIGNPIAAILDRCSEIARDLNMRAAVEQARQDTYDALPPAESARRLRETIANLGKAKAAP